MIPERTSKRWLGRTKLLVLTSHSVSHSTIDRMAEYLNPGDVLVVNRSATLPASFRGRLARTDEEIEIRLAAFQGPDARRLENWLAFSFGSGDWRMPTERRGPPPKLRAGDRLRFGEDLIADVLEVHHGRLLRIRFYAEELERALYRRGRPIQYSYLSEELSVWDQQTLFAGPPISVEAPSAAFPFTWEMIFRLKQKGVVVVPLLHGAGISSTGCESLDSKLPLAEWFDVPRGTAEAVNRARASGRKVLALGTTALRALESAYESSCVVARSGLTNLKITPAHQIRAATALLTGMHEPGTSHLEILTALCGREILELGYGEAQERGYRGHEYGDVSLVDCGCRAS